MKARRGEAAAFIAKALTYEGDECLLWPFAVLTSGYPMSKNGTVHSIACEAANGPRPEGADAAHSCGHKLCCTKRHLRWATRSENERDKLTHGRSNRGERHGMSFLTEDSVRAIRAARGSQKEVGDRFGISATHVHNIRNHKAWGWL